MVLQYKRPPRIIQEQFYFDVDMVIISNLAVCI